MKKENVSLFVSPVVCILLGVATFILGSNALKGLVYLIAGILVLLGIVAIVRYIMQAGHEVVRSNGFTVGLIMMVLGIFGFVKAEKLTSAIPFILGFCILLNGIRELQNAIDVFKLHLRNQWIVVMLALINAVVGIIIMVNPGIAADVLMKIIGVGLIVSGLIDLITTIVVLKNTKPLIVDEAK